jgi:hypothetical protein
MEDEQASIIQQKESVKLYKNKTYYNWDLRLVATDKQLTEADFKRLKELNDTMIQQYGSIVE